MNVFCCYTVITSGEEGWVQQNSSVTCRPRQRHYFNCPFISNSGGRESSVNVSTKHHKSVSSQLRRQRQRSLASYRLTNIHLSTMWWVPRLNILLFIQIIFYMFYDAFLWSFVLMVYIFYLISIFVHWTIVISIMCILLYYHTQDCIVRLTSFFDRQIIFFSRVLLYTICLFFVPVLSLCSSTNIYA